MLPIIRIEIESMKEVIQHSFSERMLDMSSEVKHALDLACTQENLQRIIDETTQTVVKEAVQNAIKRWWAVSEEGRALIDAAVTEKLNEEAAFYTSHRKGSST